MKNLRYLQYTILIITVVFCSSLTAQETNTFTDSRDGIVYKTVKIGDQRWMAENLNHAPSKSRVDAQHYKRMLIHDRSTNTNYYLTYMGYDFDESHVPIYGYLYDFETAYFVCPDDWHLPSHDEWSQLANYLGKKDAGTKMREQGTSHWTYTHRKTPATNSSGFTALPGGTYGYQGRFENLGKTAYFWSSTGPYWYLNRKRERIDWNNQSSYHTSYMSVRCIKD